MDGRYKELAERLVAVGQPHRMFSCSDFHELYEFIMQDKEIPSPCTPEQYKEITGKEFPEHGAVWINLSPEQSRSNAWQLCTYKEIDPDFKNIIIVQTGERKPFADWGPE